MGGEGTRRHLRGSPHVLALARGESSAHGRLFVVENLSAGGALLVGDNTAVGGSKLHVRLMIPGRRPVELEARVLRRERRERGVAIAVAFQRVPAETEELIQTVVRSALGPSTEPQAMIVHAPGEDVRAVRLDLEALGFGATTAHTPLDALHTLQEAEAGVAVLVAMPLPWRSDLLSTVAGEFPAVRLVAVCEAGSAPVRGPATALHHPWTLDSMAATLGVRGS